MYESNNKINFTPRVKYSSNPDSSVVIVSEKAKSKFNFIPELSPIKLINPTNNKFTICKISYGKNIQPGTIYLSTQTLQSLKIKLFKKINIELVSNDLDVMSSLQLKLIDTLDCNSFTDIELWENFIKPYFSESESKSKSKSNQICTIGDIIIMCSDGCKVKYIVQSMLDPNYNYSLSGFIDSNTKIFYITTEPIKSTVEFYSANNQFITYDENNKKFKLAYDFSNPLILKKPNIELDKSTTNSKSYNIKSFFISLGLSILYLFILWNINLLLHNLFV
jgi:hypothetical protein